MRELAADLGSRIQAAGRTRVTVLDFVDLDNKPTKLGKFLAQQLAVAFAEGGGTLEVVDQSQLPQLFDQIAKLSEGLIDQTTKQELGKVTSTEVVVVATVIPSSITVRLDVKAIDLRTAKVLTAKSTKVARLGGIVERLATESEGGPAGSAPDRDSQVAKAAAVEEKARPAVTTRSDLGVVFEVEDCTPESGSLTCTLMVTSEARNRRIEVGLESRVWDESGSEYPAQMVAIANSSSERDCLQKEILKGVPTLLSLSFPNYSEESAAVQQLRIFWGDNTSYCHTPRAVNFERIPLGETAGATVRGLRGGRPGAPAAGGRKGGLLNRLGSQVMGLVEGAIMDRVETEASKLRGDDEEEEEEEPKKKKKPAGQG